MMDMTMIVALLAMQDVAPRPAWPAQPWSQVDRARFDGAGKFVGCTTAARGPIPADNGSFCDHAPAIPPELFELLRGPPGAPFTIVAEMSFAIEGMNPFPADAGREQVSAVAGRFRVGGEGDVEDCTTIEEQGPPPLVRPVCSIMGPFVPELSGRVVTLRIAFSRE